MRKPVLSWLKLIDWWSPVHLVATIVLSLVIRRHVIQDPVFAPLIAWAFMAVVWDGYLDGVIGYYARIQIKITWVSKALWNMLFVTENLKEKKVIHVFDPGGGCYYDIFVWDLAGAIIGFLILII